MFWRIWEWWKDNQYRMAKLNRVAVEAASPFGWHQYVGDEGQTICLDHFGASAPAETIAEKFGLTADNIIAVASRAV